MRITDTSYNFTGLAPDNSYTVTVVGRNNAGVGESTSLVVRTLPYGTYVFAIILSPLQEQ